MIAQRTIRGFFRFGLGLCLAAGLSARDSVRFEGTIVDSGGAPVQGAAVTLVSADRRLRWTVPSDSGGDFRIPDLPRASYRLECAFHEARLPADTFVDTWTSREIRVFLKLTGSGPDARVSLESVVRDVSDVSSATTIDASQMRLLPSGNSIWSLIENQDLSATTNRLDVGGLWAATPALWSARGSTSWTQSAYLLNGMDFTDPYSGGLPLFFPDYWSLETVRLENAGHPARFISPGGVLDLGIRRGGDEYRGTVSAYYSDKLLSSSNITPGLAKEGLLEANTLNTSLDAHFDFSGPIVPGKLTFFTSWTGMRISRDMAEFPADDRSSVASGLARLDYESGPASFTLLWTGQTMKDPTLGAGRRVPFESTLDRKGSANVVQALGRFRLSENHFLSAGAGFGRADTLSRFQESAAGQHGTEILRDIPSGPAAEAGSDRRDVLTLFAKGELFGRMGSGSHRFFYGVDFKRSSSDSSREIMGNAHLRFFEGNPLEVVLFGAPVQHRESAIGVSGYLQETLISRGGWAATLGVNLDYTRGRVPGAETGISWLSASPRLGLVIPLSRSRQTEIKLSAGRYYFNLPLSWLTYGNSGAAGGLAYAWQDRNGDRLFEPGEAGRLLRREGPLYATIDPKIQRPYTDELSVGIIHQSARGLSISLVGYLRRTRHLVETLNTGVPFDSYTPRTFTETGDDRIAGSHDDLSFILYDQSESTLGKDFLLLTNPGGESRRSRYEGLDFAVIKRSASGFSYFVSLTAMQCSGMASPGNSEWENDDGVIGSLYDNPNTLINADGRLRFDRAYTGRIGFALPLPLGIRLGYLLKYYDGQPFARKIVITGYSQGPFYIMAHPRGVARYEFNMTNDVRLQKSLRVPGGVLRIMVDGFNIFNQHLATEENPWSGPDFLLRFATEIESPRVFRLGLSYEF
jgi:hypothetical protein